MKVMVIGLVLTASGLGLGMAMAGRDEPAPARGELDFPRGCIVMVAAPPGYLPRAGLIVDNRLAWPVHIRLEARGGSELAAAEIGTVGARRYHTFTHVLPAGRNILIAQEAGSGRIHRQVLQVNNLGADTCGKRAMARIE